MRTANAKRCRFIARWISAGGGRLREIIRQTVAVLYREYRSMLTNLSTRNDRAVRILRISVQPSNAVVPAGAAAPPE